MMGVVDLNAFVTMIVSLFAITAPIAVLPIFLAATTGQSGAQRRTTALVATGTYVVAGCTALFVGNLVLHLFGVSIAALRVAGMAVIAVIGWQMLNAPTPAAQGTDDSTLKDEPEKAGRHHRHAASNTRIPVAGKSGSADPSPWSVGIMPMGFPIYAGPGVLSVIIGWGSGSRPVYLGALVAILANGCIICLLDLLADPITRLVGEQALLVTEKVFGLLVVAIAVGGMTSALVVLFPGLGAVTSS